MTTRPERGAAPRETIRDGRTPGTRRFSLRCDEGGSWRLTGAAGGVPVEFRDLPAALAFARHDAKSQEADIELWADGLYILVHQTEGWPRRICGATA